MRILTNFLWIYVAFCGSAVYTEPQSRESAEIETNEDFLSSSRNLSPSSDSEIKSYYFSKTRNDDNDLLSKNKSNSYQHKLNERWSYISPKQPEEYPLVDDQLQFHQKDASNIKHTELPQHYQKKRVKVRRKKSRRRSSHNATQPITTLTAMATVIDNSNSPNAETTTRMEIQKRLNPLTGDKYDETILRRTSADQSIDSLLSPSDSSTATMVITDLEATSSEDERGNLRQNGYDSNNFGVIPESKATTIESQPNYDEPPPNKKRKGKGRRGKKRKQKSRQKKLERKRRLEAREEKRRLQQAKREMREKRKLQRMERRRKKLQQIKDAESSKQSEYAIPGIPVEAPARATSYGAQNKDYKLEKSFNYLDFNNDTFDMENIETSSVPADLSNILVDDAPAASYVDRNRIKSPSSSERKRKSRKRLKSEVVLASLSNAPNIDNSPSNSQRDNNHVYDDSDIRNNIEYPKNPPTEEDTNGSEGDLSCFKDGFVPAPEIKHADIKYLRNDLRGHENAFLEVEYICHQGYRLEYSEGNIRSSMDVITERSQNSAFVRNVYCKKGKWHGAPPLCVPIKDPVNINETCNYPGRCEQLCYVEDGLEKCTCLKGFKMKGNRCEDINECTENISVCEYGCINTVGSYKCKCPKGLRVGDANSCIDVNECILRNGHGPCQDTCINTWGSYKCTCDSLAGSRLSPDGHSCEDLDECSINNGGCSHTCLNTMGRAFCLCPEGWMLDKDWKTCVDVDECAEPKFENLRCEFGCINTPGSYSCLVDFGADQPIEVEDPECPDGYYRNTTTDDCQDIDECSENNGGCFDRCVNTVGSFHCACQNGYIFADDKYTCIFTNSSSDVSCPPLFPPRHGYLECSRPIASDIVGSDANGLGGRRRITNRPGSQCVLRCPTGFRINGKFSKQCSESGQWVGDDDGTCIRYPKPKLICPSDIVLETPPNETMAKLRIPRPKTDVNYERDVTISPEWVRNSEVALEVGIKNITYTARHPVSKLTISCTFSITVLEGEPPAVKFCPQNQQYSLSKPYDSIKVVWREPVFTDNVNVTDVSRTNRPGNSFGVGSHQIIYVARDQAGYSSRCVFKLLVNVPYKQTLNHPLPIYHMFYK